MRSPFKAAKLSAAELIRSLKSVDSGGAEVYLDYAGNPGRMPKPTHNLGFVAAGARYLPEGTEKQARGYLNDEPLVVISADAGLAEG